MDTIEEQVNLVFELRYKRADDYSLSRNLKVVCVYVQFVPILYVLGHKKEWTFLGVEKQILLHLFCIHKSRSPKVYSMCRNSLETSTTMMYMHSNHCVKKFKYEYLYFIGGSDSKTIQVLVGKYTFEQSLMWKKLYWRHWIMDRLSRVVLYFYITGSFCVSKMCCKGPIIK